MHARETPRMKRISKILSKKEAFIVSSIVTQRKDSLVMGPWGFYFVQIEILSIGESRWPVNFDWQKALLFYPQIEESTFR
jgi:hypothetical protein